MGTIYKLTLVYCQKKNLYTRIILFTFEAMTIVCKYNFFYFFYFYFTKAEGIVFANA